MKKQRLRREGIRENDNKIIFRVYFIRMESIKGKSLRNSLHHKLMGLKFKIKTVLEYPKPKRLKREV